MSALLHTSDLSIGYDAKTLLRSVSLNLQAGEVAALIGVNGSGKSTLLRTIAGLQTPLAGSVRVGDRDLHAMSSSERARAISVVLTGKPQAGLLDVRTLVSLGRQPWTGRLGLLTEKDHERVDDALRRTGTMDFAYRSLHELSDGEAQKVMIARALAQDAPVMLLDEPTAFLDLVNRVAVMRLLRDIARSLHRAVLVSTHDLAGALQLCDRIHLVHDGILWSGAPAESIATGVFDRAFAAQGLRFDPVTATLVEVQE
ncbi:MAG: ABC transporter ATP-binding protein [Flavobacteriales bacterium]|nr:ABC transporter ATP-binding protein [Flavobacteriales bacterium]